MVYAKRPSFSRGSMSELTFLARRMALGIKVSSTPELSWLQSLRKRRTEGPRSIRRQGGGKIPGWQRHREQIVEGNEEREVISHA